MFCVKITLRRRPGEREGERCENLGWWWRGSQIRREEEHTVCELCELWTSSFPCHHPFYSIPSNNNHIKSYYKEKYVGGDDDDASKGYEVVVMRMKCVGHFSYLNFNLLFFYHILPSSSPPDPLAGRRGTWIRTPSRITSFRPRSGGEHKETAAEHHVSQIASSLHLLVPVRARHAAHRRRRRRRTDDRIRQNWRNRI